MLLTFIKSKIFITYYVKFMAYLTSYNNYAQNKYVTVMRYIFNRKTKWRYIS